MRNISKVLALFLVLALMVPMFAGCAPKEEVATTEPTETEEVTEEAVVIGVSLPTQREERWVRDKEAMEKWASDFGVEIKVQVAMLIKHNKHNKLKTF